MRKMAILFLALVMLIAVSVGILGNQVYAARDQVELTQEIHLGDATMVDDVTIRLRTQYDYHLFWDTTYRPGAVPEVETDHRFSLDRVYEPSKITHFGVRMESILSSISMSALNETPMDNTGLALAYAELAEATPAGEERSKEIYLKDYIDYYPIYVEFSFPQYRGSLDSYTIMDESELAQNAGYPVIRTLQEYFRIPVLANETLSISIEKNSEGQIYSSSLGSGVGSGGEDVDAFRLYTLSDCTDDACYFTFNAQSEMGHIVDLSLISGGYGIYRLPLLETEENICPVDATGLEMVYPLDPTVHIYSMGLDVSEENLMLYTEENGTFCLTVIDPETMETRQKLELITWSDEYPSYMVYDEEDFIAFFFNMENCLLVLERDENGLYQPCFRCPISHDAAPDFTIYEASVDFNGERLILAKYLTDTKFGYNATCNFCLAVFDDTGMIFYGEYESSLTTGHNIERYDYHCRGTDNDPITVSWD